MLRLSDYPVPPPGTESPPLEDFRFRLLIGTEDWQSLRPDIRRRFSKQLSDGESVIYTGVIEATAISRAGRLLAQVARLIGAPLPLEAGGRGQPAVVTVTEDRKNGGQFWTRLYGRRRGFPQIIHSAKRFAGPTGLEEYIGYGLGIALAVEARNGALIFKSAGYFLQLSAWRLPIPAWLTPGDLEVGHHDRGQGRFSFTLTLSHALFGTMIRQSALFCDTKEPPS